MENIVCSLVTIFEERTNSVEVQDLDERRRQVEMEKIQVMENKVSVQVSSDSVFSNGFMPGLRVCKIRESAGREEMKISECGLGGNFKTEEQTWKQDVCGREISVDKISLENKLRSFQSS